MKDEKLNEDFSDMELPQSNNKNKLIRLSPSRLTPPVAFSPESVSSESTFRKSPTQNGKKMKFMTAVCYDHNERTDGETLEAVLYCETCGVSICYKCAFEKHKEHQVSPIHVAAENIRQSLHERKREIENLIAQVRVVRKSIDANNDDLVQRLRSQFELTIQRLRIKEKKLIGEVEQTQKKQSEFIHDIQNSQETTWGQIDAILKEQDDNKLLQEFNGLPKLNCKDILSAINSSFSSARLNSSLRKSDKMKPSVDLDSVHDEIEKISLTSSQDFNHCRELTCEDELLTRQKKKFMCKLDSNTAHPSLKITNNDSCVEYLIPERFNGLSRKHYFSSNAYNQRFPYNAGPRLKLLQFATVLGDNAVTQGKHYWEVSVNRGIEYRLGSLQTDKRYKDVLG